MPHAVSRTPSPDTRMPYDRRSTSHRCWGDDLLNWNSSVCLEGASIWLIEDSCLQLLKLGFDSVYLYIEDISPQYKRSLVSSINAIQVILWNDHLHGS